MVEKWIESGWKTGTRWIRASGIIGCPNNHLALALTLIIPMLVVALHWMAVAKVASNCPSHMREIIDELSSPHTHRIKPVANHSGTKLLYDNSTNERWVIFLFDVASKSSTLIENLARKADGTFGTTSQNAVILGWSLDDKYFAFTRHNLHHNDDMLVVGDGISGAEIARLHLAYPVTASTWLASQKLLVSDGNRIDELAYSSGHLKKTTFYAPKIDAPQNTLSNPELAVSGEIKSLQVFGSNSIVCQVSNSICLCGKGRPLKPMWQATNANLMEFCFSEDTGKFLLHCEDNDGQFLACFCPDLVSGNQKEWAIKNEMTDVVRLDTREYHPEQIAWINQGRGYAYLGYSETSLNKLMIKPSGEAPLIQLPIEDVIHGFSVGGTHIYAIGASTNEPAGIWGYDLASGAIQCLVPSMETALKYASIMPAIPGHVTNAAGEQLTFYLFPPVDSGKNQKHPLLVAIKGIAEKGYDWDRLAQMIANSGGYYVSMDRRNRDAGQWADDALCAYKYLVKRHDIDADRVFLLGISAGDYPIEQLLRSNPDLWKGAIFMGMSTFPDPAELHVPFVLLDEGGNDEGLNINHLLDSQNKLAAAGIRPMLMLHPGVGHVVRTTALLKERMKQFAVLLQQP